MQLKTLRIATLAAAVWAAAGVSAFAAECGPLKVIDPDNDGRLELAEVRKAASDTWKKVSASRNKSEEFLVRLGSTELSEGTGGVGVLEKEYVEIATSMFKAADADKDGSVDCKELEADIGLTLLKMLK